MSGTGIATTVAKRPVEGIRFQRAFRQVPAPVAILLVRTGQGRITGITCTSAGSLSGNPPMAMVAIDDKTGVVTLLEEAGFFSLNYLAADRAQWAQEFASRGSGLSALAGQLVSGRLPVTTLAAGTTSVLECSVASIYRGGDHRIVCGNVLHARFQSDAKPLVYHAGSYGTISNNVAGGGDPT